MRDNLDGISIFVEAVEAGGFARAADRLALTRSAVGKSIARLEARLGVKLFNRSTRSQSLTEEGQAYYERCLKALDELRAGQAMIASGQREVSGRLRVTMPRLFGRYCVAPILFDLVQEYPKLELDLHFSDAVIDIVAEGFDLAVRNGSPGHGQGLSTRRIARQTKTLCASPSYLAEFGVPQRVEELGEHAALVYWLGDRPFPWTFVATDGTVTEPTLKWRQQFNDHEAIVDAAARGMGLACVPTWLIHTHLNTGSLVALLTDYPSPPLDTFAVWPETRFMPLRLRTAIDRLAGQLISRSDL